MRKEKLMCTWCVSNISALIDELHLHDGILVLFRRKKEAIYLYTYTCHKFIYVSHMWWIWPLRWDIYHGVKCTHIFILSYADRILVPFDLRHRHYQLPTGTNCRHPLRLRPGRKSKPPQINTKRRPSLLLTNHRNFTTIDSFNHNFSYPR